MAHNTPAKQHAHPTIAYAPPRCDRMRLETTRQNLFFKYADSGQGVCSRHNHSTGGGCDSM